MITEKDKSRFWKRVNIKSNEECWEWTGSKTIDGYGWFYYNHIQILSHRFSCILAFGSIPEGLIVLHNCDNKSCVNPNHLSIGTYRQNSKDCHTRTYVGRRLSISDVITIRNLYGQDEHNYASIAKIYSVAPSYIKMIVDRRAWAWVD